MNICPISVVIPTYQRPQDLLVALAKIQQCDPRPAEIIVHIDNDDQQTELVLQEQANPSITILKSKTRIGPGGGRNRAITVAKNEIVASFDDDSYPIDPDYFARLLCLFDQFPGAAIIGACIYHIDETVLPDRLSARWDHAFVGCGCAYRKSAFEQTTGYVPLPLAYGMEEVDLALRLHHLDWKILNSPWLRVFHSTRLEHHNSPEVTAASIANLALLSYLRYPISFWWLGIVQGLNRIFWLIRHGRFAGIAQSIFMILPLVYHHRKLRQPISSDSLRTHLQLRQFQKHELGIQQVLPSSICDKNL